MSPTRQHNDPRKGPIEGSIFYSRCQLTHLYLGHNNLPNLPPEFALLTELVEVDLVKNAITQIKPMPELKKLEEHLFPFPMEYGEAEISLQKVCITISDGFSLSGWNILDKHDLSSDKPLP